MADGEENNMPKDAKMIKTLLKSMGIEAYEPSVVRQFLELYYRNTVDLLMDAKTYSNHAEKSCIGYSDIKLAIESKNYFSFKQPTVPEVKKAAMKVNKSEMPRLPNALPPVRDTLIAHFKFQNKELGESVEENEEETDDDSEVVENAPKKQVLVPESQQEWRTNLFPLGFDRR